MAVEGHLHLMRLVFREADILQHVAPGAQRAVEHLAHDVIGPGLVELVDMHPVIGARDDMQIGAALAGIGDQLHGVFLVIHRHHQHRGMIQPRGVQQFGPGRIAEEAVIAKAAHQLDRGKIVVQHHRALARRLHHAVDDLSETARACDDDLLRRVDLVGLALGLAGLGDIGGQHVVDDEDQRRQQHRQGDDQQQDLDQRLRQHMLRDREGNEDEAELPRLCQA